MSQINVNVVAPLGYTGPALTGNNNNVEIIDESGARMIYTDRSLGYVGIGGSNSTPLAFALNIGPSAGNSLSFSTNGPSIAIGPFAMQNSQWTGGNTAIGANALQNTTGIQGINNVAIGSSAGRNITDGENNVLIGNFAGFTPVALTTGDNNIVIGAGAATATATTNNSVTLGNSSVTTLRCAVTSITSLSDARDKKEVEDLNVGLEFIDGLRPVKFIWDDREEEGKHDIADFGFIAQDLKAAEEAVEMADVLKLVYDENPEKLEASYGKLIPILVKAIQELSAEVKALKASK
jgi:hypothetical protein